MALDALFNPIVDISQDSRRKIPETHRAFDNNIFCKRCGLHLESYCGYGRSIKHKVCLHGSGPTELPTVEDAQIVFIGEAPGATEIEKDNIFVGDSGELLNVMMAGKGISRNFLYLTNSAKCRPSNNRTPDHHEILSCRSYLVEELLNIQPKVIVTLGAPAAAAILLWSPIKVSQLGDLNTQRAYHEFTSEGSFNIARDKTPYVKKKTRFEVYNGYLNKFYKQHFQGIEATRGVVYWSEEFNCYVVPTIHPSAALHKEGYIPTIMHDLEIANDYERVKELYKKKPTKYRIVQTSAQAVSLLNQLSGLKTEIAMDTETTGFDFLGNEILCLSVAWAEGQAAVIPLKKSLDHIDTFSTEEDTDRWDRALRGETFKCPDYWNPTEYRDIVDAIKNLGLSPVPKVMQNGKFDIKFLRTLGVTVKNFVFDTMLAHHLIDENLPHDLEFLATWFTDMGWYDTELKACRINKKASYATIPARILYKYACCDADATLRVFKALKELMLEQYPSLYKLLIEKVMPRQEALADIEYEGILIDKEALIRESEICGTRIREIETELISEYLPVYRRILYTDSLREIPLYKPEDPDKAVLNLGSSQQLARLFFDDEGCGYTPKKLSSKTEAPSVDVTVLQELGTAGDKLATSLLELRSLKKLKSTYMDGSDDKEEDEGLLKLIDANGYIHTTYQLHITTTGRLCVSGDTILQTSEGSFEISKLLLPNNQNISILTHNGRMKRILQKIYKGKEEMFHVELEDGRSIKCTKGHRFLTADGWQSLSELQEGSRLCTADYKHERPQGTFEEGEDLPYFDGREFCSYKFRGGVGVRGSHTQISPVWFNKIGMVCFHEYLQRKVSRAIRNFTGVTLFPQNVGQYFGKERISRSRFISRYFTEKIGSRQGVLFNSYRDGSEQLFCSEKYKVIRARSYCKFQFKDIGQGLGFFRETRKLYTRITGIIQKLFGVPGQIFRSYLRGFYKNYGNDLVYSANFSEKKMVTRGSEAPEESHMLAYQQIGNAVITSFTTTQYKSYQGVHIFQELARRFCFSWNRFISGSRRIQSSVRELRGGFTRPEKKSEGPGVGVQASTIYGQRDYPRVAFGGRSYQEGIISSIKSVGILDVWDIEVEDDHSYIAQGFINHNSSSHPNLQNIPRDNTIRNFFIPRPGYVFLDCDYMGAELRMAAVMSGDPVLIERLKPGRKIHYETASDVFHIPIEDVTDLQKLIAKTITFGILYGRGPTSIAEQLKIPIEDAKLYIKNFFLTYKKLKVLINKVHALAKEGRDILNPFGRARHLYGSFYENIPSAQQAFAESLRQAINSPIQGGASDVTLDALVRCWRYFRDNKLLARVVLNVHDQLLFEVHESLKDSLKELLPKLMYYKFPDSPVEFLVDINECYKWEKA